uniref:Uncharacterized protein n=1 Tax=Pipistrellus kuhlii TaxID=59472 RepID=A0A7J7UTF4_PIPKU|nr:hypothetical protein mPipKuh1_008711 [Pipistrellus kuhlii]
MLLPTLPTGRRGPVLLPTLPTGRSRAQAEALGGPGTRTKLFALLHLPPRVGGNTCPCASILSPKQRHCSTTQSPGPGSARKLCRPLHRGGRAGEGEKVRREGTGELEGALENKREAGDWIHSDLEGAGKVHGVRRQGVWL